MEKTATVDLSDEHHCVDAILPVQDHNAIISANLRRRHNEASLLCHCPPEILELIFSIAASRPRLPLFAHSTRTPHPIPMVARISHVCNYWRDVCLNDPRLWTNIDIDLGGRWPMVFMRRSGSAALNIVADMDHRSSEFLDSIVHALPRVQSLHIRGLYGHLARFVQKLTSSAPILEAATFHQSSPWYPEETVWAPPPQRVLFSTTLFSGDAPRLRDLSMRGCCPANRPMAAFSRITTLRADEALSIYDTMCFLHQTAGLVALDVGPNTFGSSLASFGPARTIRLPNLTKLKVRMLLTMDTATAFLSTLHVPNLSQLDVSISVQHADHGRAQRVLNVLSTLFTVLMKRIQGWHKLTIIFELSHVSTEFGEPLEHGEIDSDRDPAPPSPFVVSWNEGDDTNLDLEGMWLWTLDILPLYEVTFLSIVQGYEPSGRRWHRWSALHACRHVTTLRLETQYPKTVTDILGAATPAPMLGDESDSPGTSTSETPTPACLFPQLKKVILVDVPLKARGSKLLPVLRQFALSRKTERSSVGIAFEGCNYSADLMVALHDVAELTWDGK